MQAKAFGFIAANNLNFVKASSSFIITDLTPPSDRAMYL